MYSQIILLAVVMMIIIGRLIGTNISFMKQVMASLSSVIVTTSVYWYAYLRYRSNTDSFEADGWLWLLSSPWATACIGNPMGRPLKPSLHPSDHFLNFQLTSGRAFSKLKEAISGGAFGRIHTITGIGMFRRTDDYFQRTPWAGKTKIGETYILDGATNNPLSHLLNNMLALSGMQNGENGQEAAPNQVTGELYHANRMEGDDTSCIRVQMNNGVTMCYYATLCHSQETMPTIRVQGEGGSAIWSYDNTLMMESGGKAESSFGEENSLETIYLNMIRVIPGEERQLICPVASTRNFVLVSNGAYESISDIPDRYKLRSFLDESTVTAIKDVEAIIQSASDGNRLFSESGVPRAVPGKPMDTRAYDKFPAYFGREAQSG